MAFGIALIIATYGTMYDVILKVLSFMSRPLLFVSAVFYTASDLPSTARYVLSWNPLAQIIEHMRFYALGMKLFPEADIAWPMLFTLIVLFFGFAGYYANRHRLIQSR
jgi:capsular polysaccharide transport system permease protein